MSYPIVLSFNAHDPTGGAGIAADALTCASLEASAFTVATTLLAGDFSRLEAVIPLDADWVDDQARTLLEDSVVHAIKIGVLPDVQIVRVIAEIMADYPQVPVILAPSILVADDDDGNNAEDIITATHELILPNANLLIAQRHLLRQLAEVKHNFAQIEEEHPQLLANAHAQALLSSGCEYVFATDAKSPDSQVVHQLFSSDGLLRTDTTPRLKDAFLGANSTLSAAISALIAHGQPTPQAIGEALEFTWQTLRFGISMGMGKKIPDRFYWTRQTEDETAETEQSPNKRPAPSSNTLQ